MSNNILITGGAGFIGHHIISYLLDNTNNNIVTIDRLDTSGSLNRIEDVLRERPDKRGRVKFIWHDLKSPLNDLIRYKIGPIDYILHLAAGSHVDRSIIYPMEFVMDNVVGTTNLLDYARKYLPDLKLLLNFSTDEVFGPAPPGVFYKENDRYNCGNPYSATKAGAEELCMAYENTYKMPIIVTHTMNVFGIRQHWEKYIPLVIKNVLNNKELTIHADKTCTEAGSRHYISTQDVAEGVLFLMSNGVSGEKYNLVGSEEIDNLTLALTIAEIMNKPLKYKMVDFHSSRPGHDLRYALDGTKMKDMGWEPSKNLRERLEEVVNWTLNNTYWISE